MDLYVLRHGIAADPNEWRKSDAERPLTEDGVRKMKKAAKGMRRLELTFDWILASPYRRTLETAEIVADELKLTKKLKKIRSLASAEGSPRAVVEELVADYSSCDSILIVGHEPHLSHLIGTLTAGGRAGISFNKGSLAKLSAHAFTYGPCAQLHWLLTSKILRSLA